MTKTITFACLHFSVAFGVAYALTGSALIGGAMALVEPMINTVVFYFHERAWRRWEAGRETHAQGPASGRHLHLVGRAA